MISEITATLKRLKLWLQYRAAQHERAFAHGVHAAALRIPHRESRELMLDVVRFGVGVEVIPDR
jgi:hypothetical protein